MQALSFAVLLVIGTLLGTNARPGRAPLDNELLDLLTKLKLEKRQDPVPTPTADPGVQPPPTSPAPENTVASRLEAIIDNLRGQESRLKEQLASAQNDRQRAALERRLGRLEERLAVLDTALADARLNPDLTLGEILAALARNRQQGGRNRSPGAPGGGRENAGGQGRGQGRNAGQGRRPSQEVRDLEQLLAEERRQLDNPQDPGAPAGPAESTPTPSDAATPASESRVVRALERLMQTLRDVEARLKDRLAQAGEAERPGLEQRLATLERQLADLEGALAKARNDPSLTLGQILSTVFANEIAQQVKDGVGSGRGHASGLQNGQGDKGRGRAPGLQNEQGQGRVARLARLLEEVRQALDEAPTPAAPVNDDASTAAPVNDEATTAAAPVNDDASTAAPVNDDASTAAAPVNDDASTAAPVNDDASTAAPVNDDASTAAPVNDDASTAAPVNDETPTAAPVNDETPTAAPANDEATTAGPAPDAAGGEDTTVAPLPTAGPQGPPSDDTSPPADDNSVVEALAPSLGARLEQTREQAVAVLADLLTELEDPQLQAAVARLLRDLNKFYRKLSSSVTAVENGEVPRGSRSWRPKKPKKAGRGRGF